MIDISPDRFIDSQGPVIRRYTSHLLTQASHVTAVDFMESFVEKNRQDNSHHGNASFLHADVTKLDFPKNRSAV
uniref:phosphoethanolamine N-methyltransferase n=1 Tax=Hucho hucho TaxID=62062 RepID=A0A4W5KD55_9TELE